MPASVFGRDSYVELIKKYAESAVVGNQAFLGVKGVGKTSLFQHYFTKEKRKEIADKYKKLFVFSQLDSRKGGSDLYIFLLDQVKKGILGIPNDDDKKEIRAEMDDIDAVFESPEGRLTQYLTAVKEKGYDLIIIMDQFHCMARDTEVGSEQYDVLRSFNEQKLITYWIVTDTDLMETCATKQYIASFFAQKFTNKLTICPLGADYRSEAVGYFASQKKIELSEDEKDLVSNMSGGVPELMSILIDILYLIKKNGEQLTENELVNRFLLHDGGISLFENWVSGLNNKQKELLFDIASSENGICESEVTTEFEVELSKLSDDVGRGLLHKVNEDDEKSWCINIELFRRFIVERGVSFYLEIENAPVNCALPETAEPKVTNIYNISGNFIGNQTNNILSIENAVTGLEDLQKLVAGNSLLLEEGQAAKKLEYLPFRQEIWKELPAEEQEQELEKYADGVFSSEVFSKGSLSPKQMNEFCLNDSVLGSLSDSCRNQIICGIQVYTLIQLCIDNFGLSMSESESPRGILFARAFERHLKDFAAPAYCRVPEMAAQVVYPTTKVFKNYPIDKTTIGTYSALLGRGYKIFAQASMQLLGYKEKDEVWWKTLVNRLSEIGELRNDCCHSGTAFGNAELLKLRRMVFSERSLEDILLFGEIPALQKNQFVSAGRKQSTASHKGISVIPDINLLGKEVKFQIKEKNANGTYRGTVDGKYEGSLPKKYAENMNFATVKGTEISAIADNIQDGKYVLKI